MKKYLALLLALVMVFALAACGGEPASDATEPPVADDTPASDKLIFFIILYLLFSFLVFIFFGL